MRGERGDRRRGKAVTTAARRGAQPRGASGCRSDPPRAVVAGSAAVVAKASSIPGRRRPCPGLGSWSGSRPGRGPGPARRPRVHQVVADPGPAGEGPAGRTHPGPPAGRRRARCSGGPPHPPEGVRMSVLGELRRRADRRRGRGRRPDRAAVGDDADPPAAAGRSRNTGRSRCEEISRYDDRGPAWYWNNIHTGEHTGTHFDAPVHWVTGRDGEDVAQVPRGRLIAPGRRARLRRPGRRGPRLPARGRRTSGTWEAEHGPLPDGGWLLYRTGWDARSADQEQLPQRRRDRPAHARHLGRPARAGWPRRRRSSASGVETVGTDAGAAHSFDPPFPCHSFLLGAGKYGLTQLQNLARLPAHRRGLVVAAAADRRRLRQPGAGARPGRAREREPARAGRRGGRPRRWPGWASDTVFGVVGSGNFHVTNALVAAGARFVAARHEGGAARWPTRTPGSAGGSAC